ncbi:MAG: Sodium/hydrogen exchanger family protein [Candidatus Methanoperedenaceae archaeon GB37]|nr:MAG: Sodium/hydrogen exchanger family protein [Candidatus Methanoperedenaceae archaeon GB37]
MHLNQAFSLMIITIGAALLPNISYRLKLPPVVAEILFGVLIGKTFLNVTFSGEWLPFLANLGFLMLMFLAGVEINFSMLEKQKPRQLLLYGVIFIATLTLAYIFSLSYGTRIIFGFNLINHLFGISSTHFA